MKALFTAATGMEAQQYRLDTVANNLANVGTTGFKRSRAEFHDLFYETLQAPGAATSEGQSLPTGTQIGHGVRLAAISRVFSDGERVSTERDLDLSIDGDGFFQITRPDGDTVYTRDGAFQLDRDGNLVNALGYALEPNIQIPTEALQVTILRDGTVSVLEAGQTQPTNAGQIDLARFSNPAGLRALGGNLFATTEASGDPETGTPDQTGFGSIAQGFLESSNVNMAEELVHMILAQRAFEVNSRVLQAGDEMMRTATVGS
ncbi:MAG: flagellar basal-body rod protein FlgG [Myxococcales bacterium]|nr:flagellar basal-body rod protein FlgG [Myxococcales bacterium]